MTERELYIINRAIDGRDVKGLPPLSKMGLSEVGVDSIKKRLICKDILESNTKFTEYGLAVVKKLQLYKTANKYIEKRNLIIGVVNDTYGVMLLYNPLWNRYKLNYIKLEE